MKYWPIRNGLWYSWEDLNVIQNQFVELTVGNLITKHISVVDQK